MKTYINLFHTFRRALCLPGVSVLVLMLVLMQGYPEWAQANEKGPSACQTSLTHVKGCRWSRVL